MQSYVQLGDWVKVKTKGKFQGEIGQVIRQRTGTDLFDVALEKEGYICYCMYSNELEIVEKGKP